MLRVVALTAHPVKVIKNYRVSENTTMTARQVSGALLRVGFFFYNKQLIQIHQDKTKPCEARSELSTWYAKKYDDKPHLVTQILNLELAPFSTSQ